MSGTVTLTSDNSPLEGAHIIAVAEDNSFNAEAYSDSSGGYSFNLVGSLNYYVNISYDGLVDHNEYLFINPFENTVLDASLDVLEDGLVEGILTDWYTNAPLSGASVLFAYNDGGDDLETIETTTDESGYFMSQVPGEQGYDLFLYAEGYWVEHDAFFLSSGASQVMSIGIAPIESASRLYGTISDYETGEVIPYAEVQLNCDSASDWDHTGDLGTYRVFNYYSGDCDNGVLVVSSPGYETSVQSVGSINFDAGSSVDLDVALVAGDDPDPGMLSGTVYSNIDSSPIDDAEVQAYNISTTQLISINTSDDGSYQLFLPESDYYVSVNADNHQELFDTLSIVSGQSYTKDFNLDQVSLNTLSGTITDQSGAALHNVEVVAIVDGGTIVSGTFTDESGYYELDLINGTYDIVAGTNNYHMQGENGVEINDSGATVDLVLEQVQQFDGGVAGVVHLNDDDNSQAVINIRTSGDLAYNAYITSDASGAYSLPLLNGTYNVTAWVPGSDYEGVFLYIFFSFD